MPTGILIVNSCCLAWQVTVGIAAVQNRSRLKNKCKPNDMKQNIERPARHSSNTLVVGNPSINLFHTLGRHDKTLNFISNTLKMPATYDTV